MNYRMTFHNGWFYITENGKLKWVVQSFTEALQIVKKTA